MPNRIIKESIRVSEKINLLSAMAEVTFYRLMVSCDDYGRFDGRPLVIKGTLFPLKENITVRDIEAVLEELLNAGLMTKYIVDGKPYIQLCAWEKHQRIRETKGKFPAPDESAKTCGELRQIAADCGECQQSAEDCGELRPESKSESEYKSNNISNSNELDCQKPQADFRRAIDLWNTLTDVGIKPVSRVAPGAKRFDNLRARIREYGMAEYENAINRIRGSDFLQGKHGGRPWQITFDWFVLPSNFPKVLDGNYDNSAKRFESILDSIT